MKVVDPKTVPFVNGDPRSGRNWAIHLREVLPHTEMTFSPVTTHEAMLIRSAVNTRRTLSTKEYWKTWTKGESLIVRRKQ